MNKRVHWAWACVVVVGWAVSAPGIGQDAPPQSPGLLPDSVVSTREANLVARLRDEQSRLGPDEEPSRAQKRVDGLAEEAGQLADLTTQPTLRLECLSIQLQALYLRVTRWPEDVGINDHVAKMRETARRLKAVRHDEALAAGDFWLATVELWELKRSGLSPAEQQRQGEQVLRSFIVIHDQGPSVDAARSALRKLGDTGVTDGSGDPLNNGQPATTRVTEATGEPLYTLGEPVTAAQGVVRIPIRCRYQRGENVLRVLTPTAGLKPGAPVRFLLVLPVEAGEGADFGDPLEELRKLDVHNRHGLVVVCPTLSDIPWYADHPSDLKLRQYTYITRGVLPAMRELFPSQDGRVMLLGFSKSGWGAMNLLVRNPRDFDAAAAWDTPLMVQDLTFPGMKEVFATQEQLARHSLADKFRVSARQFRKEKRIALLGYENFREHHEQFHKILTDLEVPHDYVESPSMRHRWDSGWMEQAVEKLIAMTRVAEPAVSEQ